MVSTAKSRCQIALWGSFIEGMTDQRTSTGAHAVQSPPRKSQLETRAVAPAVDPEIASQLFGEHTDDLQPE